MENRKRALPQWLSNVNEKSPSKKCQFSSSDDENVGESSTSVTSKSNNTEDVNINVQDKKEEVSDASEHPSSSINDDLLNCNKKNYSQVEMLQDSKSLTQEVNFEISSDDENIGESSASVAGKAKESTEDVNINVQDEKEVVSDASEPRSPSINGDPSNCNKENHSQVEMPQDSRSSSSESQDVNFEISSCDENIGESSTSVTGKANKSAEDVNIQDEKEVLSDSSEPSIVPSVPHLSLAMQCPISSAIIANNSGNFDPPPSPNYAYINPAKYINSEKNALVRPICKYGDSCYRKNPQHKVDFFHPGNDDFTTVENKPECEYGISCYRKNPLHRQYYKHTKNVRKPRKAKLRTTNINNDNSSDDDDYDLQDPFINNDSSDDYEPEGSDDTDSSDPPDASRE